MEWREIIIKTLQQYESSYITLIFWFYRNAWNWIFDSQILSGYCYLIVFIADRGEVPKGSSEIFFRKVKFWEDGEMQEAPPVFVGIIFLNQEEYILTWFSLEMSMYINIWLYHLVSFVSLSHNMVIFIGTLAILEQSKWVKTLHNTIENAEI